MLLDGITEIKLVADFVEEKKSSTDQFTGALTPICGTVIFVIVFLLLYSSLFFVCFCCVCWCVIFQCNERGNGRTNVYHVVIEVHLRVHVLFLFTLNLHFLMSFQI